MQRIWADERPADRVPRPPPVARITPRTILTLRFDAFVTEEDDQRLALALQQVMLQGDTARHVTPGWAPGEVTGGFYVRDGMQHLAAEINRCSEARLALVNDEAIAQSLQDTLNAEAKETDDEAC